MTYDTADSHVSGRLQMGHQITPGPYASNSYLPDKLGGLMAALHTSLVCRALRNYSQKKKVNLLKAHGLYVHKSMVIIYLEVTLSKDGTKINARVLFDGISSPSSICAHMKYFFAKLK